MLLLTQHMPAVLATVLQTTGSVPRGAGACMLVSEAEQPVGTVGGGVLEHHVLQKARECLSNRRSAMLSYQLTNNEAGSLGMVCGGNVTVHCWYLSPESEQVQGVFDMLLTQATAGADAWLVMSIEPNGQVLDAGIYTNGALSFAQTLTTGDVQPLLSRKATLVEGERLLFATPAILAGSTWVFGGGHIAQQLVPLLHTLDFCPIVFDDRAEFASRELFPTAERVLLGDFENIKQHVDIRPTDYVVIMTRGHRYDHELLTQVLRTDATYIGLIGSRSKIAHTKSLLFEEGFTEADFARVHTPIGLAIYAQTPAEIAVSIAAEMIMHRNAPTLGSAP